MLVVEGAAGTGKTALLDELVSQAEGFQVLAADGLEDDQAPLTVLRTWDVDPPQASDGGASTPFIATQALRQVVDRLAEKGPVLIRLDDLHWADPESVEALTWLLRRMSGDQLLVAIGTRRLTTSQHAGWQRWAASHSHSVWLRLTGLSLTDARKLIESHRPSTPAATSERLWEHTSGNPLYLTALLEEYDEDRLTEMRILPAPAAFAQVLGTRVARLPEAGVRLLRAAAVLGAGWVSLLDVAAIAEVDDPAEAAQSLTDSGLAQVETLHGTMSIRLAHALVRSAVYSQTPLPQRRALHLRAAGVVAAESAVLEHRMAAAEQYDEPLAEALEFYAASLYSQRSFRLAGHYQLWSSVVTREPVLRERRWLESLFYRAMDDDVVRVHSGGDKVQRASDPALRALVLGTWAVWERRRQDGIELLGAIAELPIDAVEATTRYRIEIVLAWARIGAGHPTPLIAEGIARARQLGVADAGLADLELVSDGTITARLQGAVHVLNELRPISQEAVAVPLRSTNQLAWRGALRAWAGFLPEAVADLSEAARRIQDGVTSFGVGSFHAYLGFTQWLTGEWSQARLNFRLGYDLSGARTHPMVLALAPVSQIGEGRFSEADLGLAEASRTITGAPWFEACQLLLVARVIRLHAQGSATDRARLLPSLAGTVLEPTLLSTSPIIVLHIGLAAVWCHDTALAERCANELDGFSPRSLWISSATTWLRGLIAEDRDHDQQARDFFAAAVGNPATDLPLYQAHMLVDEARVATRSGQDRRARESRARAETIYRSLGAKPYLDRLAASHHPDGSGGRRLPAITLTDREKDVVTLVLDGMSYAQIAGSLFITQSTVAYHLSNVYAKTGVRSRHRLTEKVRDDPRLFGLGAAAVTSDVFG